jgi:hypothetical protein
MKPGVSAPRAAYVPSAVWPAATPMASGVITPSPGPDGPARCCVVPVELAEV